MLGSDRPADISDERDSAVVDSDTDDTSKWLGFDPIAMPTAVAISERLVRQLPERSRDPMQIAKRMESFLSTSNEYSYTLKLDHPNVPWMDPIEQFLSVDKSGHCQFFASALVMMLRSQGIPARIVVGYRTDEYNELGQYYLARQMHAHAWVEALIGREYISPTKTVYGQPQTEKYWVRLEPTPSYSLSSMEGGGVSQVFDLAQNIWDDYVVDMDGQRQSGALASGVTGSTMSASYGQFFGWMQLRIAAIRAGQLGGGSLAGRPNFSWTAALATILSCILAFFVTRLPLRAWIRNRRTRRQQTNYQVPRFAFYQETLHQLARLGINREHSQTPNDVAAVASDVTLHPDRALLQHPLQVLTSIYYRARYRGDPQPHDQSQDHQVLLSLDAPDESRADAALTELRQRIDQLRNE